jgi:hypothetical protein
MPRDDERHPGDRGRDLKILCAEDAAALLREAVPDHLDEGELVLGLDWSARLCGIASRFPERDGPVPELCAEHLRLIAEELVATELVLVTFVEAERVTPTAADVARFEGLRVECRAVHVELFDHLLMAGQRWRSIAALTPLFSGPGVSGPGIGSGGGHAA